MTKKQKTASWQEYARAESFLPWNANPKIFKARVSPHWILPSDDRPGNDMSMPGNEEDSPSGDGGSQ